MFTKCVGQALYQSFRTVIGFLLNDLRLSLVISGSEKQRAVDNEEESEACGKNNEVGRTGFPGFSTPEQFSEGTSLHVV